MAIKPPPKPIRVLVTGYGPVQWIENNPTSEIAKKLASLKVSGAEIRTEVLPVTWKGVDDFVERDVKGWKPDVVISMGFSDGHHEVKEFAVNKREGADAGGVEGGNVAIDA